MKAGVKYPQVNVERWREHVVAALEGGQSFRAYALEHGVSRHTLYAAQALMRQRGELPAGATVKRPRCVPKQGRSSAAFVPVAVRAGLSLTALLPNGVRLQCQASDEGVLQRVLTQLAGLSCSG